MDKLGVAKFLEPRKYPLVEQTMTEGVQVDLDWYIGWDMLANDVSFAEYMPQVLTTEPDVIFFTANSAVPVADSVRGYYEELGMRSPELAYITANSHLSDVDTMKLPPARWMAQRKIDTEIKRLNAEYRDSRSIIFDQFVETGGTLDLAESMLAQAGIHNLLSTRNAHFYREARNGEIDKKHMTSSHRKFMQGVGQKAAQLAEVTSPHI